MKGEPMGRRPVTKNNRIYRETLYNVCHDEGTNASRLSEAMGYGKTYLSRIVYEGYGDVTDATLNLMALTLGVSKNKLTEVPVSPHGLKKEAREAATKAAAVTDDQAAMVANLNATVIDGFAMLHQDIQMLIETMHKYWKPEEPKYEVKEKEQD